MTAPDKICVAPHQIYDNDLDTQATGYLGAEEYIRKGYLLDWIKKNRKHASPSWAMLKQTIEHM